MIPALKKHIFLFLSIIAFAFIWISQQSIWYSGKQYDNYYDFNVSLTEKEYLLDSWMDSLKTNLDKGRLALFVNNNKESIDWLFSEHGISFSVYSNGNFVYWTNNSIVLPADASDLNTGFYDKGNAAVEIRKHIAPAYTIIGSILIKYKYPYENTFLKNQYHKSLPIGSNIYIEKGNKTDHGAIFNKEGEYLFTLKSHNRSSQVLKDTFSLIFFLIAIILILTYGRNLFSNTKFKIWHFIIFAGSFLLIRFAFQFFIKPDFIYNQSLFNPKHFASSLFFPSLGDVFITVALFSYLIFVFYSKVPLPAGNKLTKTGIAIRIALWFVVIHFYCLGSLYVFRHLIDDSSFQFEAYKVLRLSIYSFVGYLVFILSFIGLILLIDKATTFFKSAIKVKHIVLIVLSTAIVFISLWLLIGNSFDILSYITFLFICLFWIINKYFYRIRFVSVFVLVALISTYTSNYIQRKSFEKRIEESKVIAVGLASEQDPVAEVVISDVIFTMHKDSTLKQMLWPDNFNYNTLFAYIQKEYFEGYLRQYDFQLTLCSPTDSLLVQTNDEAWYHCYNFFNNLIQNEGFETNIPNLYYLKNNLGLINYLFQIEIELKNNENVSLFIELLNKPIHEVLGYPELLLKDNNWQNNTRQLDNYAKYSGNRLLTRVGDFPYAFDRSVYGNKESEFAFFQSEGYDHLVYNYNNNSSIVISNQTVVFYNALISFTYIFLFFLIIVIILSLIGNRFTHIIDFNLSIKNRITFSMLAILVVSMIFVGTGTAFYTKVQFENNQNRILSEKIQSVLVEIEHKLSDIHYIEEINVDYLNNLLIKFSNVFYTDINMYDLQGNLIATSRNEIFDRQLTSNKINAVAYRELVLNKKARVVHKENIGELEYYSAYVPFISADNKLLAYLNLPYFSKEIELRQELLRVLVAVVNIYAFLFILSIIVAIYMSNRLTEPLRLVQQRIRNIDLSKQNERLNYTGDDEIAELVNEYNRMLDELDLSARLLAKSERESAWREMARQIAHEIKNPLTPMKLSVQLLEKSWNNNDSDFEDRLKRVAQTLIDQIDSLSSIATAFSQFAQMPPIRSEKVNLLQHIQNSGELFEECSNVRLTIDTPKVEEVNVLADKERMVQVFNNLIKNAIQAIPKNKVGEVFIGLKISSESVVVEIRDNGIGIPPDLENHLFEPNFTTKGSGTGLGLAIVKNIIEEFGGAIWFKSKVDEGTSFFVSMPLFKE